MKFVLVAKLAFAALAFLPLVAPAAVYDVTTFGATGDRHTLDTVAIQKAIDVANGAGGGTVFFPTGAFLTGTITLKSHVTLHLSPGAVLLGSPNLKDYPVKHLIYAKGAEDIAIEVNENDLRIDVYRSSGKGGQGVNTTDSAVRITHIPTGIVVVCQNERSQLKNKAAAMSVLKARLYEKKQDEQRAEMDKFYGEKGEIGWGAQIRSYVLQPYQMVKDLRTGISTSDTQGVLDGDLDRFINAWLRAGCPRHRNKDIQMDE